MNMVAKKIQRVYRYIADNARASRLQGSERHRIMEHACRIMKRIYDNGLLLLILDSLFDAPPPYARTD